jgi:hypothetical protein
LSLDYRNFSPWLVTIASWKSNTWLFFCISSCQSHLKCFLPWFFVDVVSFRIYIPSMQRSVDVFLPLKDLDQFIILLCVLTKQMEIFLLFICQVLETSMICCALVIVCKFLKIKFKEFHLFWHMMSFLGFFILIVFWSSFTIFSQLCKAGIICALGLIIYLYVFVFYVFTSNEC